MLLKISFFVLLFVCSFLKAEAKGRDVVIFLKDFTEVKGELLSVRDSLVAVAVEPISQDVDIAGFPERVRVFPFKDIQNVRIEENSYVMTGSITGTAWGALAIVYMDAGPGFFRKGAITESGWKVAQFLIGGALVGSAVGYLASDQEEKFTFPANDTMQVILLKNAYTFYIPSADAIGLLKEHARFEKSESAYLRDVINNLLKETK